MSNQLGTTQQQETQNSASAPLSNRCGIISLLDTQLRELMPEISIDDTDTQGMLRKRGVFQTLHDQLLLSPHCTIRCIFIQPLAKVWRIVVESPDFPSVSLGCEFPSIIPIYAQHIDGSPRLEVMRIESDSLPIPISSSIGLLLKS